jgi:isobutyryl-CoA mutase
MVYEQKKRDGSLPLIDVNTFLPKDHGGEIAIEKDKCTPDDNEF